MAEAMLRCEAAGFPPILTVHDEIVAEVPVSQYIDADGEDEVLAEFISLLETLPSWAEGCPVAAEGWMGFRYRK